MAFRLIVCLIFPAFLGGFDYCFSQSDPPDPLKSVSDSILKEGVEIYECILASGISSEFVIEKLSLEEITGSVTYKKNNTVFSVFLMGAKKNTRVRYSFSYPAPFSPGNIDIDGEPRPLGDYEVSLEKMREKILKLARKRKSFFTNYEGILLNPVFISRGDYTYAYLLSSSRDQSFVPFGNDYLFVFDKKSKIVSMEKIHQNLIEVPVAASDTLQNDMAMASFHTHSEFSSPFISSTDVCTLLLQKAAVNWESHIVVSPEYVSFFFPSQNSLEIITREEYEKMSKEKGGE